jgi:hypothetical protein
MRRGSTGPLGVYSVEDRINLGCLKCVLNSSDRKSVYTGFVICVEFFEPGNLEEVLFKINLHWYTVFISRVFGIMRCIEFKYIKVHCNFRRFGLLLSTSTDHVLKIG